MSGTKWCNNVIDSQGGDYDLRDSTKNKRKTGEMTLEQLKAEELDNDSDDTDSGNEAMEANFTELESGFKKCLQNLKKTAETSGKPDILSTGHMEQSIEELTEYYERREQMHKMEKETLRLGLQKSKKVIGRLPAASAALLNGLVCKEVFTHTPIQWCDEKYPKTGLLQVIEKKDERIEKIRTKGFKYKWQAKFAYFLIVFTHLCRTFPNQTMYLFEKIFFPVAKEFVHGSSKWAIVGRYVLAAHFGGYYALKAGLPAALKKIKDLSPFN